MVIFLSIVASVLFCLVVYIVFFNTDIQETFISEKKKKRILEIIDDAGKTNEEKVDILISILQQNGKKNYIKLYKYLDKNRYNKKFNKERMQKIDSILFFLDSFLCNNSRVTHMVIKIEKSLNNRDYEQLKEQIEELKSSLVNQRYNDGFNNLYNKIASITLAVITILSFIMAFKR
jgi:hypothetical protein